MAAARATCREGVGGQVQPQGRWSSNGARFEGMKEIKDKSSTRRIHRKVVLREKEWRVEGSELLVKRVSLCLKPDRDAAKPLVGVELQGTDVTWIRRVAVQGR